MGQGELPGTRFDTISLNGMSGTELWLFWTLVERSKVNMAEGKFHHAEIRSRKTWAFSLGDTLKNLRQDSSIGPCLLCTQDEDREGRDRWSPHKVAAHSSSQKRERNGRNSKSFKQWGFVGKFHLGAQSIGSCSHSSVFHIAVKNRMRKKSIGDQFNKFLYFILGDGEWNIISCYL